jgi:hypothetical protein
MELLNTRGQSTAPSNRLVQMLRHHPLVFFFLLAFGLLLSSQVLASRAAGSGEAEHAGSLD